MSGKSRMGWLVGLGGTLLCLVGLLGYFLCGEPTNPVVRRVFRRLAMRRLEQVTEAQNVVDCNLRGVDLSKTHGRLATLRFNLGTRWPATEHLPAGESPLALLTNAMNPGLGVKELHRRGVTGAGVSVAIVDYPLDPTHPEYAAQMAAYRGMGIEHGASSMHGPAVASLLVGKNCGTAPGARLFYVATTDPGEGLPEYLQAMEWLLQTNAALPLAQKIRVVSISASPDGERIYRHAIAQGAWPEARRRAEAAGMMVLDFARESAFIGPCEIDPQFPEDPAHCKPILAQDWPDYFAGHLLVPVAPRTIAEAPEPGTFGYQYCGIGRQTFRYHGVSWAAPYCAGVLAMGWQVRPDLTPSQMRDLLFRSACMLPSGQRVIQPAEFVRLAELEPRR